MRARVDGSATYLLVAQTWRQLGRQGRGSAGIGVQMLSLVYK